MRVGLQLGYDDLELLNPLGVCRGEKKIGGFYGAIMNLPAEMRFKHQYMSPLCIVEEKLLTKLDPVRVVSGADPTTGEPLPEDVASLGAQLRALEKGVTRLVSSPALAAAALAAASLAAIAPTTPASAPPIAPALVAPAPIAPALTAPSVNPLQMPCGPDSTEWEEVLLQVRLLDVSSDFLAKTKLVPTAQSTSATNFCPHCNYNKNAKNAKGPFSFLAGTCPCNGHAPAPAPAPAPVPAPAPTVEQPPNWRLRDLPSTLACLEHAFRINDKNKRAKFLTSKGLRAKHPHVRRHALARARLLLLTTSPTPTLRNHSPFTRS